MRRMCLGSALVALAAAGACGGEQQAAFARGIVASPTAVPSGSVAPPAPTTPREALILSQVVSHDDKLGWHVGSKIGDKAAASMGYGLFQVGGPKGDMYYSSGTGLLQLNHGGLTVNIADGKILRRKVSWDDKAGWRVVDETR